MDCLFCTKKQVSKLNSRGAVSARLSVLNNCIVKAKSTSKIKADNETVLSTVLSFIGASKFKNSVNYINDLNNYVSYSNGNIVAKASLTGNLTSKIAGDGVLENSFTDKIGGDLTYINQFDDFQSTERLYPIADITTSLGGNYLMNESGNLSNLYASIDEGVFTGNYTKSFKSSSLVADEQVSYIQPSSIHTEGEYRYKFEVTAPSLTAIESFLFLRASAPLKNLESDVPPEYTISNIKFEDPSGNLIVQYNDINIRGDANYSNADYKNFATYISSPLINNAKLNAWEDDYPIFGLLSGYTLNMDISAKCLDDSFNKGFNLGYQDTCSLTSSGDESAATNALRITAVEIVNSGALVGLIDSDYLNFYTSVRSEGDLLQRSIYPSQFISSISSDIYPETDSLWTSSPNLEGHSYNSNMNSGLPVLKNYLRDENDGTYITLTSLSGIPDSGKLTVKFSHEKPTSVNQYTAGAFEGFGSRNDNKEFDSAYYSSVTPTDSFFLVHNVELKVVAKKAIGSRDFALDVVGYSDDKLLNISPSIGGFLQNTEGSGTIPASSGFYQIDDLGISSESFSDKSELFFSNETNNAGGDHYLLANYPIVSGTEFEEYTIPLSIYEDDVILGKSVDYSMSSYFENIYLDIFPIPSGASIAKVELVVQYKPSNALLLSTVGRASEDISKRDAKLFPSSRKANDLAINTCDSVHRISYISGIPHGFDSPDTIKTNYSRRWRGVDGGVVAGPYNPYTFDFSFYNPELKFPFVNGYFSFNNDEDGFVISDYLYDLPVTSGQYIGNYNRVRNLGLRFKSDSLFSASTDYTTTDWCSITGYESDALYGRISDGFDNAVRVSGSLGYINFGEINVASGFAVFARFTPDITVSGAGYNLFNSGVIFAKYDSGKNLEFSLGYNNGNLEGKARADDGTIYTVTDSLYYYDYNFPLSTMLVYNDTGDNKLHLYVDNEHSTTSTFHILRDQSAQFTLASGDSDFIVGHSFGDGIGFNAFITDIGLSFNQPDYTNIVRNDTQIDRLLKQTTASQFFNSLHMKFWESGESYEKDTYKLWDYVNEDSTLWTLGDFTVGFSQDYTRFIKRVGSDFVEHRLKHDGSVYENHVDLALPSSIPEQVSYHTQIENDSLRFNLAAAADSFTSGDDAFYSARPRISKNLPRNYLFQEESLCVDTILQHTSDQNMVWPDSTNGPRLIVSLYSPNKENVYLDTPNQGLITRHIHNIEYNSGEWHKITSVFNFEQLTSNVEPWSNFNQSQNISEFESRYLYQDIDNMFVQYDLVYPSSLSFDSTVRIHSSHVRLKDALIKERSQNNTFTLFASGDKVWHHSLSLDTIGSDIISSGIDLFCDAGSLADLSENFNLFSSGGYFANNDLGLYAINFESSNTNIDLFVDGKIRTDNFLDLYLYNTATVTSSIDLFTKHVLDRYNINNQIEMFTFAVDLLEFEQFSRSSSRMGLFSFTATPPAEPVEANASTILYLKGYTPTVVESSGNMPLFSVNYLPSQLNATGKQTIDWNGDLYGYPIESTDNDFASLAANDEIRGVNLLCYGNCASSGTCIEPDIITHKTIWYSSQCVDGGIFRAKNTYTNISASGFNTDIGYSGHFYGIRKYIGLIPFAPYYVNIVGKTGSEEIIETPREMSEWEYGRNEEVGYSGVKLTSNYEINEPSGRQIDSNYGKSVSVKGDLAAIGAPRHNLIDSSGVIEEAGSVFVYRRDPQPSGYDWSEQYHKAPWRLEAQLALPSSILRDSYVDQEEELFDYTSLPFKVTRRYWEIGMDGRQFGHSLSIAKPSGLKSLHGNDKEIIAVGGPSCKFTRTFEDLEPSGVNVGLLIFTDKAFQPEVPSQGQPSVKPIYYSYLDILKEIENKDLLFRYFSNPPVKFNVKIGVIQAINDSSYIAPEFPAPKPDFIINRQIPRHSSETLLDEDLFNQRSNEIYSGIKNVYDELFPYDTGELNNNIPPILGVLIDNSASLGESAIQPGLDSFVNYFKQYSFASGLSDFYNNPASGIVKEVSSTSRNWILQSNAMLNDVLDTGNLIANDEFRLFSSGVGEFNSELNEFNIPPNSGGAVFIFEKESDDWNLIQKIDSPTLTNKIYPDRFGTSVSFSDDANVLVIGSPYINDAVTAYQYNDQEQQRMLTNIPAWLSFKIESEPTNALYSDIYSEYLASAAVNGSTVALLETYKSLDNDTKYDLRSNKDFWGNNTIKEYTITFSYPLDNTTGDWYFLTKEFAPNSRLGYSVDTNSDGSIIVAGAPTDSLDEFDDSTRYFAPNRPGYTTWPSYINTGAVRIFESRKYYPPTMAIEYGKFGNLQYDNRSEEEDPLFNHMGAIFNDMGVEFRKTQFADTEIPQEAGVVFIITPAIDALSEEIILKLKNWLALGDRNLVLVGNDPVWESEGLYYESNIILNKILESLDSRIRLHSARTRYESLPSGYNGIPNTITSFKPDGGLNSYVTAGSGLIASGVADIKMYYPDADRSYDCVAQGVFDPSDPLSITSIASEAGIDASYGAINDKCEIPIKHNGDLRSQWNEMCASDREGTYITYPVNWPLFFGTVTAATYGCGGEFADVETKPTAGYDAVPILAAAETVEEIINIDEVPPRYGTRSVIKTRPSDTLSYIFGDPINEDIELYWASDSGNYNNLNLNLGAFAADDGKFFDPVEYNGVDCILQARAINTTTKLDTQILVSETANYAVKEQYKDTSSSVICIAGLNTEDYALLDVSDDIRRMIYVDLVKKDGEGVFLAQLGDWTGRSTFKSAFSRSHLKTVFSEYIENNSFIAVQENVSTEQLLNGYPGNNPFTVCWIANPAGTPNENELNALKSWLSRGNNKLIITYSDFGSLDYSTTNNVVSLLNSLEIESQPIWLNEKNRYASKADHHDGPINDQFLFNENIYTSSITDIIIGTDFVPISSINSEKAIYANYGIFDDDYSDIDYWRFNTGVTKVNFNVDELTAYRLFFKIRSEHFLENEKLNINISNVNLLPNVQDPRLLVGNVDIFDIDNNGEYVSITQDKIGATYALTLGSVGEREYAFDVYVPQNISDISVYIDSNDNALKQDIGGRLKTVRLASISGCKLNIDTQTGTETYRETETYLISEGSPAISTSKIVNRSISTDSSKYCPDESCIPTLGNKPIADGPVLIAQELEIFSPFDNGVNRSRITVISDSSLIQGKQIANEDLKINANNIALIQSLYPRTSFPSDLGRYSYNIINKIKPPELGSPAVFYNTLGVSGLNMLFTTDSPASSGKPLSEYIQSFDDSEFEPALHPRDGKPPTYVEERVLPLSSVEELAAISGILASFNNNMALFGAGSKFSYNINGTQYEDSGTDGGTPSIMHDTGYDFLDFDIYSSGYPGDLFGYSVSLQDNKLVVGSPFAAYKHEDITNWQDVINSSIMYQNVFNTEIGFNGGAGSVYIYEKTGNGKTLYGRDNNWECVRKIRPSSINIGQDLTSASVASGDQYLGNHSYNADYLTNNSIVPDQFGRCVVLDGDMLAIGAPGHDFNNYLEEVYNSGAFIRKAFNFEHDIPQYNLYDLGSSGVRASLPNSGHAVLNNGAIFTYENKITDWENKIQTWEFVGKILPQGFNDNIQDGISASGTENEYFGQSIAIDRSFRSDADYTLLAGSPNHSFGLSGIDEYTEGAGASYFYDGMLRRNFTSKAHPNSFINAQIKGDPSSNKTIDLNFKNNYDYNKTYISRGIIYSNDQGEIFLEASGQDLNPKGFITHRPYIESVYGKYIFGIPEETSLNMFTYGEPLFQSGNMDMFLSVNDYAEVYNNIGLTNNGIINYASGDLNLYNHCPSGQIADRDDLTFYTSGTALINTFITTFTAGY